MKDDTGTGGGPIAPVTLLTEDGFPLAGRRFKGRAPGHGVVLIAPATGAPQRFYAPFARHLAEAGWDVLTWDWRGVADSNHGVSATDPRLSMSAWGRHDLTTAIDWAARRARGRPLVLVGHSFGGQAAGLAANGARLDGIVLVAAQHGWCGHWPWPQRTGLQAFWRVAVPVMVATFGRLPSSHIGLGEDLPAGVAREWARWCRTPAFLGDWSGHARLAAPILAFSFHDDRIAPRRAVDALLQQHPGAVSIVHRHIEEMRLGHFGFFREGAAPGLWAETVQFLHVVAGRTAAVRGGDAHA